MLFSSLVFSDLPLLVAIDDAAPRQVIRRHLYGNLVTWQDTDIVHPHFAGNGRQNNVPILKANLEIRVREGFRNLPILFDQILF